MGSASPYQRFFGPAHPGLVIAAALLVGVACLTWLHRRGFRLHDGEHGSRGLLLATFGATLLAVAMILVDLMAPLPADLNVPLPTSLLFYPSMALFVEVAFHLAPLTVFLFLLMDAVGLQARRGVQVGIVAVALLEPTYQLFLLAGRQGPGGFLVYLWLHIFALNLLQLFLFRRFGFLSMVWLRLVYYLHWHIVWGYLRLPLLF